MDTVSFAKDIRRLALQLVYEAKESHIGGALSMADILAVLYGEVLNVKPENPLWEKRDRFVLSKGHCCSSLYATLAYKGFFPMEDLSSFAQNGSRFLAHTTHHVEGIEVSAGSLGHGLPICCGLALGAKAKGEEWRTYCLVGDGEMDEGSNWEAIMFAAHNKLDNLCLVVDYNKIQSLGNTNEIINLEPLKKKFEDFNWNAIEIDGHNHDDIKKAFVIAEETKGQPTAIIANTVKGKGVSFMENKVLWHYRNPNKEQLEIALGELQ